MCKASEKSDQGTLVPETTIVEYNSKQTCKYRGLAKYQLRSCQETSGRSKVNNLKSLTKGLFTNEWA